jgi:hypothetical protein
VKDTGPIFQSPAEKLDAVEEARISDGILMGRGTWFRLLPRDET